MPSSQGRRGYLRAQARTASPIPRSSQKLRRGRDGDEIGAAAVPSPPDKTASSPTSPSTRRRKRRYRERGEVHRGKLLPPAGPPRPRRCRQSQSREAGYRRCARGRAARSPAFRKSSAAPGPTDLPIDSPSYSAYRRVTGKRAGRRRPYRASVAPAAILTGASTGRVRLSPRSGIQDQSPGVRVVGPKKTNQPSGWEDYLSVSGSSDQ
jgi:hypothetical protein